MRGPRLWLRLRGARVKGEQLADRHVQASGKGADTGQGWIADAAFDARQVSDMDAGTVGYFFLGFVSAEADLPSVTTEGDLVTHRD